MRAPSSTRRRLWVETWQESEWKRGASRRMMVPDGRVHSIGEVLEIEPPLRLVLSWRCEIIPEARAEGHSRVTCELEKVGDSVKLTFIQENDTPYSTAIVMASNGWPLI